MNAKTPLSNETGSLNVTWVYSLEIPADIGADECQTFNPDMDQDRDVDGQDIALMILSGPGVAERIEALARAFGL